MEAHPPASSPRPQGPPDQGTAAQPREVTFYVLEDASSAARLRLACRIIEKAYDAGHRVLVWQPDAAELEALDDLLWTSGDDRSFIPHERFAAGRPAETPVLLAADSPPGGDLEVLVNLAPDVPEAAARARRIVEIIDGEPGRRAAGRARFKAYRDLGWPLTSHNVRG